MEEARWSARQSGSLPGRVAGRKRRVADRQWPAGGLSGGRSFAAGRWAEGVFFPTSGQKEWNRKKSDAQKRRVSSLGNYPRGKTRGREFVRDGMWKADSPVLNVF